MVGDTKGLPKVIVDEYRLLPTIMTWKFKLLKWLGWAISALVFMASVFGSLNYARLGVFGQLALSLTERSNPVFDTAKQAISLAIGAVRNLQSPYFWHFWHVANILFRDLSVHSLSSHAYLCYFSRYPS